VTLPNLQEQRSRFVQRNTFLYAALGLLSASDRLERVLQAAAAAPRSQKRSGRDAAAEGEHAETDLLLVYAALGALSLSRRIRREAQAGSAHLTHVPVTAELRPRPSLRELAR
jgi:hypothetical protein